MSKPLGLLEERLPVGPLHRVVELRALPDVVLCLAGLALLNRQLLEAVKAPSLLEQRAHLVHKQVLQVLLAAAVVGLGPEVHGVIRGRLLVTVVSSLAGARALGLVVVRAHVLVVFLFKAHRGGSK